jgi:hypothetical protein
VASDIAQTTKTTGEYLTGFFTTAYERIVEEGINTLEYIQNLFGKNIEDQVGAADSVDTGFGKVVEDQLDMQDVYESNFGKFVTDSLNITDDVNGAAVDDDQVADFFKVTGDQLEIGEYDEVTLGKALEDQTGIGEFDEIGLGKVVEDQAGVGDDVYTVQFLKQLADDFNVTDDVNGAAVDDDQVATFFKVTSDQFELVESNEITLGKVVVDPLNVGEILTNIFNKQSEDSLNISNPGIISNQNYGSNYFLEDYVGVSRTIS